MTEQTIRAREASRARGERVELLAGPGGEVKVRRIRRERVPVGEK